MSQQRGERSVHIGGPFGEERTRNSDIPATRHRPVIALKVLDSPSEPCSSCMFMQRKKVDTHIPTFTFSCDLGLPMAAAQAVGACSKEPILSDPRRRTL